MKKIVNVLLVSLVTVMSFTGCLKESKDRVATNISKDINAKELVKQLDIQGAGIKYIENNIQINISGQMNISDMFAKNIENKEAEEALSAFSSEYDIGMKRDEDTLFCKYKLSQDRLGIKYDNLGIFAQEYSVSENATTTFVKTSSASHYNLTKVDGNLCNTDISFGIKSKDIITPAMKQVLDSDASYTVTGTIALGDTGFYKVLLPMILEENYLDNIELKDTPVRIEIDFDKKTLDLLHYSLISTGLREFNKTEVQGIKFDYYVVDKSTDAVQMELPAELYNETADIVPLDRTEVANKLMQLKQTLAERALDDEQEETVAEDINLKEFLVEEIGSQTPVDVVEEPNFDLLKFNTKYATYRLYLYYVHSEDYTVYDEFKLRNTIQQDYLKEADNVNQVTGSETISTSHYTLDNDVLCKSKYMTIFDDNTVISVEGIALSDMSSPEQVESAIITIVNALGLEY